MVCSMPGAFGICLSDFIIQKERESHLYSKVHLKACHNLPNCDVNELVLTLAYPSASFLFCPLCVAICSLFSLFWSRNL